MLFGLTDKLIGLDMRINVAQLLKGPVGGTRTYELDEVDVTVDGQESKVWGKVNLMRTSRSILVTGTLHTEVKCECSRCLATFTCPLTLKIEEEYFPTIDIITGTRVPVPDASSFTIDEHNELDLAEAIRQYAIMELPMKPLCRESCAGFCATCGHNLNEGECRCPTGHIDPRWLQLLEKVNERKGTK